MSDKNALSEFKATAHDCEPQKLSPIVLAFMGDAVYEILVRNYIVSVLHTAPSKVHSESVNLVKASAQATALKKISSILTDEEQTVFRRGRNANVSHIPKNASHADYHYATGLEALFGYLYLSDRIARVHEIFDNIIAPDSEETDM